MNKSDTTATSHQVNSQELDLCAREAIHQTTLLQPHGILLACDVYSGLIVFASSNAGDVLRASPEGEGAGVLGSPLARYVEGPLDAVWAQMCALAPGSPIPMHIRLQTAPSAGHFNEVLVYRSGDTVVLEALPGADISADLDVHIEFERTLRELSRLHKHAVLEEFLDACAQEIRLLSGYQRVVIYQFLPDWSGDVIAESCDEGVKTLFKGLRFPASDIPAQARALYKINLLRIIADTSALPTALQGITPGDAKLDLSHSLLRQPSSMHLKYLENMGVRATMTISLMRGGELWGMVSCHHPAPKVPPAHLRRVTKLLCTVVSEIAVARIDALVRENAEARARAFLTARNQLEAFFHVSQDFADSVQKSLAELAVVMNVQAYGLMMDGVWLCKPHAATDVSDALLAYAKTLRGTAPLVTQEWSLQAPEGSHWAQQWPGVVVQPVPGFADSYVCFLREAVVHQVHWAGAPVKGAAQTLDGVQVLGPRASFQRWTEQSQGQCAHWDAAELSAAQAMAKSISNVYRAYQSQQMKEQLYLLGSYMEHLNDMVVVTTTESVDEPGPRIVFVNQAFVDRTGYTREEALGNTPRMLQGPLTQRAQLDALRAAMLSWTPITVELINYTKSGEPFWVEISLSSIANASGWYTHWIAIERDVTERRQQADALRDAVFRAEQAAEAKGQFLANMSHEIRTPMNAIIGMLALLHRTELSPQQLDYAGKSQTAAHSLLGLINDILDFSKVESGNMALDHQPFTVSKLMRDLAVILSGSASNKGIDVLFDVDSSLPPVLLGDAMRLQQILINLGSNAVKFTTEGQVVVSVRLERATHDTAHVKFAVTDSGIGIAPENQHKIFDGFSQAEASITRRFGGTGLGLAISKRMIEIMGGELTLTSAIGQGSEFAFTLALPRVTDVPDGLVLAPRLSPPVRRLLVVDDNLVASDITARMAQSWNWPTEVAHSGEQALALVAGRAAQGPFPFDVIYLDWHLPGMDGWEVAKQLRSAHAASIAAGPAGATGAVGKPPLTLIMGTANGREALSQRTEVEQALLDGFLVKPFTASSLLDATLQSGANRVGVRGGRRPAASQRRLNGMRILVVEDNLINQQVAEELLNFEGAKVSLAANGQLGVDAVRLAVPQFDAVLMDLQMPVMDGFTATRAIRGQLGLAKLPIIAVTANAMNSDRDECLAAGMNAHVGKPFELTVLVRTLLQVSGFVAPHSGHEHEGIAPSTVTSWLDQPSSGIDFQGALARLSGMESLYLRAAKEFVNVIPRVMDDLRQALQEDRKNATMQMHTIKGNAALLGATALSQLTGQLESMYRSSVSLDEIAPQLIFLQRTLDSTLADLQAVIAQLSPQQYDSENAAAPNYLVNHDAAGLRSQLVALTTALASSDLTALELFAQMRPAFPPHVQDAVTSLEEALQGLQLDAAHQHCLALLEVLE